MIIRKTSLSLRIVLVLMCAMFLLAGCSEQAGENNTPATAGNIDTADLFSDRDLDGTFSPDAVQIRLNGTDISCSDASVQIQDSTVTIRQGGTYIFSGTLENGQIRVDAEKTDKIQLVFNGVNITSQESAPVYVVQADKVFVTLASGTENTLSNGGSFTSSDENNVDALIFAKDDVTLNGSGSLSISSPAGHGIVSKDELTIAGGVYEINALSHGISGKDNVCITGAVLKIISGKDGIHSENTEDTSLGFVYIKDGSFQIESQGDGISASGQMQIDGGNIEIVSGGGSVNGEQHTNNQPGGHPGSMRPGNSGSTTQEDTASCKAVKAGSDLIINGGSFAVDSADDAIHSNLNITVNGGTFEIATGDDGMHADEKLTVAAGTIHISKSYEGLEALHIVISGGEIDLVASDDGLNAAGGTDESGFGGGFGNDQFGGGRPGGRMGGMPGSAGNGSIVISGGTLAIRASGDGIDANGTLSITGGYITVCGPTRGDTATLDYDSSAVISGGTFIGTGASGMAQTFSDCEQGLLSLGVGNQTAGTLITLTDSNGKVILEHTPELDFAIVIVSTPEMKKGETYTITVGSRSAEFTAD